MILPGPHILAFTTSCLWHTSSGNTNQDGATKVARNNAALRWGHQQLRDIGPFRKKIMTASPVANLLWLPSHLLSCYTLGATVFACHSQEVMVCPWLNLPFPCDVRTLTAHKAPARREITAIPTSPDGLNLPESQSGDMADSHVLQMLARLVNLMGT
jgi:hypothetical protein